MDLTTGQMIDQLKEGQFAEDNMGYRVAFDEKGVLRFYLHGLKIDGQGSKYYISNEDNDASWTIHNLVQYVSFEEAMKLFAEGRSVNWHYKGKMKQLNKLSRLHDVDYGAFSPEIILNSKWSI